ncbi:Detected protein of unknown function [Hibiscus syriacus]|uniref:Tubby C-terminal domain-containing protein n=1 Tax=Hibiscus syriacus TaxID=106335 RepID=A0A6A3CI24_HIBSY|nr:Detected protein of unknown function [Hibiscus syriacus]
MEKNYSRYCLNTRTMWRLNVPHLSKAGQKATCTDFVISLVAMISLDQASIILQFSGKLLDVCPRKPTSTTAKYRMSSIRTRGPRRISVLCTRFPFSAIEQGGSAPTPMAFTKCHDEDCSPLLDSVRIRAFETLKSVQNVCLVLRNKAPRWYGQLQCWCLNFKGRVTVASVKNFQLVATVDPSQNVTVSEQEKVILQFGRSVRTFSPWVIVTHSQLYKHLRSA